MRLGNKGSKALEVRRIVLSTLYTADPEAVFDVEEVLARSGVDGSCYYDRYTAVQNALPYLGKRSLVVADTDPARRRKWWKITELGCDQMHAERKELEQEAEALASQILLDVLT